MTIHATPSAHAVEGLWGAIPVTVARTTGERLGPDIPAGCPSVITARAIGLDSAAAVALVERVLIDPAMAALAQG